MALSVVPTMTDSRITSGSCLCRKVEYEVVGQPLTKKVLCHCDNCRRATGSIFMANNFYRKSVWCCALFCFTLFSPPVNSRDGRQQKSLLDTNLQVVLSNSAFSKENKFYELLRTLRQMLDTLYYVIFAVRVARHCLSPILSILCSKTPLLLVLER